MDKYNYKDFCIVLSFRLFVSRRVWVACWPCYNVIGRWWGNPDAKVSKSSRQWKCHSWTYDNKHVVQCCCLDWFLTGSLVRTSVSVVPTFETMQIVSLVKIRHIFNLFFEGQTWTVLFWYWSESHWFRECGVSVWTQTSGSSELKRWTAQKSVRVLARIP